MKTSTYNALFYDARSLNHTSNAWTYTVKCVSPVDQNTLSLAHIAYHFTWDNMCIRPRDSQWSLPVLHISYISTTHIMRMFIISRPTSFILFHINRKIPTWSVSRAQSVIEIHLLSILDIAACNEDDCRKSKWMFDWVVIRLISCHSCYNSNSSSILVACATRLWLSIFNRNYLGKGVSSRGTTGYIENHIHGNEQLY